MTNAIYAGLMVLEIDGQEVEVISINPTTTTGRQAVKTMNSSGRARGYKDGIETHQIQITAAVPTDGSAVDWSHITRSKLTIYPVNKNDKRISYLDCFCTEVGTQYEVESEARIDITLESLRKVEE